MKKILNNPYFMAGLVVIAIGSVGWNSRKSLQRLLRPVKAAVQPQPDSALQPAETALLPLLPIDAVSTSPVGLRSLKRDLALARMSRWIEAPDRDPFAIFPASTIARPAAAKVAPVLQVSAIWRQSGQHLAVINGQVVREGDLAFDCTIERIESSAVFFRHAAGAERAEFPASYSFSKTNRLAAVTAASDAGKRKATQPGG